MNSDREKIQQKLKLNYYPNDISYLKDRNLTDRNLNETMVKSNHLPLDIVDIYNKVYLTNETDLDFINIPKKRKSKSPPLNFLDKLLSPEPKPKPEPAKSFLIGAPTGRQEALNLKLWYEAIEKKYFPRFKELLLGKGNLDRDKVLKAWKAVYLVTLEEIERQTNVQCAERGKILNEVVQGLVNLFEYSYTKSNIEVQRHAETYAKEISEVRLETAKKLAHFQVKIDILEREKFELKHNNGQCIIKIRELERTIDDFRKSEKTGLRGQKISTQKIQNSSIEESVTIKDDEKEHMVSVSETLVQEINKKLSKLAEIKKKINTCSEELNNLEKNISDKKVVLASTNYELDLRQNLLRPVAKYTPKSIISLSTSKDKKKTPFEPSLIVEDDSGQCEVFFKKLLEKPKDRLIQKSKTTQDHIFHSINIIYQRAIIQIELFNEILDFQSLVYKQFVKLENRKKGEKILKNFISGCLKLSDFRRVSVFLRFLGVGGIINKANFSTKTLQVYLSAYLFMDTSTIGLLIYKDTASPTQYYPLARALAAVKELSSVLPPNSKYSIESFLNSIVIQDPKQINPQGLIELEFFLEKTSEDFEEFVQDVTENCQNLFEVVSRRLSLSTDNFRLLIRKVCPEQMIMYEESIEKDHLEQINEIKPQEAIQISIKFQLLTTEQISVYLGNLENVSDSFAKNLILSQYPSPMNSLYQNIMDDIEKIQLKFGLVWWKILNNNQ